jgi:site-specific recombinase XerD
MTAEDYQRICAAIKNVAGTRLLAGRALDRGEIKALAHGCVGDRNRAAGLRDVALIGLLYSSGLRRAEAVAIDLADFDAETGAIRVLSGKGNNQRITYISDGALDAVNDWLLVRGREPGPLFCPVRKSGVIVHRRMSAAAVRLILRKRVRLAALKPATPHDMRRTFISDMLDAGADLSTAQKLAGHANPATTAAYDRRGEEAKRKAASLLHFPYQSPLQREGKP